MNVGSLFAGIGGFDLGFERCGMRVSWQVEQDPYCRAVLARHFPSAERFDDVRQVGPRQLSAVDLICGGFPCQDLSAAGRGAGLAGSRSGLWAEFARIVRELRPRYVVVENVPALLTGKGKRWDRAPIGRVLGDLAEVGYDAEWSRLSAREFGAPHLRKRVWIVAYPARDAEARAGSESRAERERARPSGSESRAGAIPDPDRGGRPEGLRLAAGTREPARSPDSLGGRAGSPLADADPGRLSGFASVHLQPSPGRPPSKSGGHLDGPRRPEGHPWRLEPAVGRVAHGVPDRLDRLAALGNALVPQIAEWIGWRILLHEQGKATTTCGQVDAVGR